MQCLTTLQRFTNAIVVACTMAGMACANLSAAAAGEHQSIDAVIGEPVTLSADPSDGTHPVRYSWSKDGETLAGETRAKLMINDVVASTAGTYAVEVRNHDGSSVSHVMNVRVCAPSLRIYQHNHGIKLTFKARKCVGYTIECKESLSHETGWKTFATIDAKNGTVRLTDREAASHFLCVFRLVAKTACHCRGGQHHDEEDQEWEAMLAIGATAQR